MHACAKNSYHMLIGKRVVLYHLCEVRTLDIIVMMQECI